MSAPLWQAGHLYLPGDIVQPITAPATTPVTIPNPGFETGDDTGWDLGTATAVSSADKFTGTYSIEFSGTGGLTDTLQDTASAVQPGQSITARMMYQQGAASAGHNGGRVLLAFYTSGMVLIGTPSLGNVVDSGSGGAWGQSTVTATAPATAAFVKLGVRVNRTNSNPSWADDFSWNHVAQAPAGLVFKAVQANAGTSGTSEPAWPNTVGLTVVDNQVTWEAIAATRVEWTASPILVSGASEPTWPTQIGEFVADGSIKWEAFSRRVEDENCPNSKIVAIVGSKVFAADRDIARFCATANPLDWTTDRDAGYLPLGLQQANANDFNTGVFNQYRSNFVAFNASSFQNWQADPDPAAMALLDQMDGVGSTWQQAAQPVANDLFYLAALGVRTVGIAGGSTNLQAGDVGMPIDPLVKDAVRVAVANSSAVRSTYYPSSGQYWLAFADNPPALPSISGAVPDGYVGVAVSGAYTVTGGVLPIGAITVTSGTFPPGLTLNPDGTYSGTPTTIGSYSWTVGGVDADGTPFSTPDSAAIINPDVWMAHVVSGGSSPAYIGKYGGDTWAIAGDTTISGQLHYSGAGLVHVANRGAAAYRYSTDSGANWLTATGFNWSSGGGRMLTHNGFLFACGGVQVMNRRPLGSSVFTQPSASTVSRANAIVLHGASRIVVASIYNGPASFSLDDGATWALGAGDITSAYNQAPVLGSNGTTLVVAYNEAVGAANVVRVKRSTDGGSTWSASVYDFPGADVNKAAVDVLADGNNWVAVTSTGQVAYSSDNGITWSLSADTLPTPNQIALGALLSTPRLMAVGSGGTIHTSDNRGVTWQARTDPAGTNSIHGVAWIYP